MEANVICTEMECRTFEQSGCYPVLEVNARFTFTEIQQVDTVYVDIIKNAIAGIVKENVLFKPTKKKGEIQ